MNISPSSTSSWIALTFSQFVRNTTMLTVCTIFLTQSALIQLPPLSRRLVYTISCDTFLIPFLTFCVNPYFYHLKHFIFSLHLLNGKIASLGSILTHWRQDLLNGSILSHLRSHTFSCNTLEQVGIKIMISTHLKW